MSLKTILPLLLTLLASQTIHALLQTSPIVLPHQRQQHRRSFSSSPQTATTSGTTTALYATSPRELVQRGMQRFRDGDVVSSISYFDEADKSVPDGSLRPFLWQRGISYYYADQFEEGSRQFRDDVAVNPLDVEEIVWDIACINRLSNTAVPRSQMMSLPPGKTDRRPIMSTVYQLFRGDATEWELFRKGTALTRQRGGREEFYALFYLGLYCESRGEVGKAESYMRAAAGTSYAKGVGIGDYMTAVARVHCELRGWV